MMEPDGRLNDLVTRGHASQTILAAVEVFCNALVDETLLKIDRQIGNLSLSAEHALAICHEIAAYRRITQRLRQQVQAGEKAAVRYRAEQTQEQEQNP